MGREAQFAEWLENSAASWDVHGVFIPERPFDMAEEAKRLRKTMDEQDCVNLFISEGAGLSEIVAAMEAAGEKVPRDPFGHVQLDKINPGQWFAKQFAAELGADKVLVQKSGYFARSAAPNAADLELIRDCVNYAVDAALRGESGRGGPGRGARRTSCGRSSSTGSRAARRSILRCRGSPTCCATWARPETATGPRKDCLDPVPPQAVQSNHDDALNIDKSVTGQPWRWRRPADPNLPMDALVDELLLARGVAREDLGRHREPRIRDFLPDPSCFQDMDKGAKRLADAVQAGETIAIFGDYDVDGATSAALLVLLLRQLGAEPIVYIPDRLMEGYGPSGEALVELKARGASVAVGVDCGAQAFDALEQAQGRRAGRGGRRSSPMREPASRRVRDDQSQPARRERGRRRARPSRRGRDGLSARCRADPRACAAAGSSRARRTRASSTCSTWSRSAPSPMSPGCKSLNRAFVTQGLKIMAARGNIGLVALAEAARLVKEPSCRDLGFALGPRINAGGRVGKSDLGVRLLTSTDPEEARSLAAELDRLNEERRAIEMLVFEQAEAQARGQADAPVIIGHERRLAPGRDRHRRRPA